MHKLSDNNSYEVFPSHPQLTDHAREARLKLSEDFTANRLEAVQKSAGSDNYVRASNSEVADRPQVNVQPGESIQRAIDSAPAGAVINVAAGVYREKLDIKKDGITLKGNGNAVLDMGGKSVDDGIISISGRKNVTIDGFEIKNATGGDTPTAIKVDGASSDIRIINNNIHDIKSSKNAHAIAIYGDSAQPIKNVVIQDNRVHNMKLGKSEAVVINGNVDGFKIIGNTVRDCDNIGIDVIGGEGTGKKGTDRPRHGLIAGNRVHNIDSSTNPAYKRKSAAGIYVDGGSDVNIRDNVVTDSNYGVELASEHRGLNTTRINLTGNRIERSHIAGISLGGGESHNGGVSDSRVENNTLNGNKRAIWKQHNIKNVHIGDNPTR